MERELRQSLAFLTALRLIVNSAHRLVYPFLPIIARGLGVSLDQAGYLVSARWAASLGTPVLVSAVGRGERRRPLLALGLALFALGSAITAATNVYVGAFAGFVLMGIAKPVFDVSAQAYLADRTPYARRARYLGLFELTWAGGLLVGAPAAGWLIDAAGWTTPFWVIAALTAVGLLTLGATLEADVARPGSGAAPLAWDRTAVAFMVVIAIFATAAELVFVALGAWLEDSFGLSILTLGGVATLVALAELLGEGGVAGLADRVGKRRTVAVGLGIATAGFVILAGAASSLIGGMAAIMVAFFGFEVAIVGAIPLATELRPAARARLLSWMVVAMGVGRTVGAAAGTRLFVTLGIPGNAVFAAAANIVALGVLLALVKERPEPQPTM